MTGSGAWPLFRRELLAILRTRRSFWWLVAMVSCSCLIPLTAWPRDQVGQLGSLGVSHAGIFLAFLQTQLILCLLIVSTFAAAAIASERERNTFEVLYATRLSPFIIAISKISAVATYMVLLLLAAAPAICVLYFLGGVTFASIARCYVVTAAALVSSALVCLKESVRADRVSRATVRSIALVAFWNFGLYLLVALGLTILVGNLLGYPSQSVFENPVFSPLSTTPFAVMVFELEPGPFTGSNFFPGYLAYAGCVSVIHLVYVLVKIRSPYATPSRRRMRRAARRRNKTRRKGGRTFLASILLRSSLRKSPLLANPVFLRELCYEFHGRPKFRRLAFWIPLILFFGLWISGDFDLFMITPVGICAMVLVMLLVPAASAGGIPREIEQGSFDLIRGTFLSPAQIVAGKFLGGVYCGLGVVAAASWVIAVMVFFKEPALYPFFFAAVVILFLTLVSTAMLSTFFSTLFKRASSATISCYVALGGLVLLLPMSALAMGMPKSTITPCSPFYAFADAMKVIHYGDHSVDHGILVEMKDTILYFVEIYGLLVLGLLLFSIKLFARKLARDR